jgi:hypothetical protein
MKIEVFEKREDEGEVEVEEEEEVEEVEKIVLQIHQTEMKKNELDV